MRLWAALIVVLGVAACDSNPTPHPQQDAVVGANQDTNAPPQPEGPDDDGDGVADCTEVQGFWDGEACRTDNDPSLGDAAGDAAGDASAEVDADPDAETTDATAPDADL